MIGETMDTTILPSTPAAGTNTKYPPRRHRDAQQQRHDRRSPQIDAIGGGRRAAPDNDRLPEPRRIPVQFGQSAGGRRDRRRLRQRHLLERQAKLVRHLRARLGKTPLGGKPSHQFRNHERDRDADGYRHRTQHRDTAPAEQSQQCRRGRRGQQRAGSREHDVETGERGAVARRRGLHHEREAGRHRRGQPEAHDEAQQASTPHAPCGTSPIAPAPMPQMKVPSTSCFLRPQASDRLPHATAPQIAPTPPL